MECAICGHIWVRGVTEEVVESKDWSPYLNPEALDPEWLEALRISPPRTTPLRGDEKHLMKHQDQPTGLTNGAFVNDHFA